MRLASSRHAHSIENAHGLLSSVPARYKHRLYVLRPLIDGLIFRSRRQEQRSWPAVGCDETQKIHPLVQYKSVDYLTRILK